MPIYYSSETKGFYLVDSDESSPPNSVFVSDEEHRILLDGQSNGNVIVPGENGSPTLYPISTSLTDEQKKKQMINALQKRLDDFAKTRNYTNCLACCTYAVSTNTLFAYEGQYMVQARDETWAACYAVLANVESGIRPIPTLEQLIAELPVLAWPSAAEITY